MKKLFLMTALASIGMIGTAKAEDATLGGVNDVPVQVEAVVATETPESVTIVDDVIAETPKNTMPPLAKNDKPIVALFYADWCGSCKILEPRMNAAISQLSDSEAVKVIKFDLTDDSTKAKSAALAGENSLTDLYNDNAPKTGFAMLVDGNAVDTVTLTKKDSIAEIKAKLEAFITASKS